MIELPQGWRWERLGDLGEEVRGSVLPADDAKYELYSVPSFALRRPEILRGAEIGSSKRPVAPDDLLICKINPRINRAWLVAQRSADLEQIASPEYLVLRTKDAILARYLMWYVRSPRFRDWIKLAVEGATGSHTRAKSGPILRQLVPIAPAADREQIVDAVEEQFSRLDAAEASLSRAKRNIGRLRAATIDAAITGDWPIIEFGEIITSLRNGLFISRPSQTPPGVPILRISAVRPMRLDVDDVRYAPIDDADGQGYFVEAGDLLFTRYSGNPAFVGACAVVPALSGRTLHPDKLIRVALDRRKALPQFVSLCINNGAARRAVESRLKTTAGQVGIAGSQLRSVPLSLPSVEVQSSIVEDVARKLSLLDAEESTVGTALEHSQRVRRAILERAFAGTLLKLNTGGRGVTNAASRDCA